MKKKSYIKITVSGESSEDTRNLAIHISSILNVAGMSVTCPYSTTGPYAAAAKFAQMVCNNDIGVLVENNVVAPVIKEKPSVDVESPLYKTMVEIICTNLGLAHSYIKPESEFIKDLGADSLDTVELVMAAEEEFGTTIDDEDAEKLITVADAYYYLKDHTCR